MKNNLHSAQSGVAVVAIIIAIVTTLAVGGAAYYFTDGFGSKKQDKSLSAEQKSGALTSNSSDDQANESVTGADTLPLVREAVAGKASIKCTSSFRIDDKDVVSKMYIKDENNIRIDIQADSSTAYTLFKNQADSYNWNEGQNQGTKYTNKDDIAGIAQQWEENLDEAEENSYVEKISCKRAALDSELFAVPRSVEFTDAN